MSNHEMTTDPKRAKELERIADQLEVLNQQVELLTMALNRLDESS